MATEAQRRANKKYTDKTYKMVNMKLRRTDDKDIIEALESAQAQGISYRDWLRALYDSKEK